MHSTTASLLLTKLNTGNRFFMRAELKDCDEESTLDARDEIKNLLAAGFIRKAGERRYEILVDLRTLRKHILAEILPKHDERGAYRACRFNTYDIVRSVWRLKSKEVTSDDQGGTADSEEEKSSSRKSGMSREDFISMIDDRVSEITAMIAGKETTDAAQEENSEADEDKDSEKDTDAEWKEVLSRRAHVEKLRAKLARLAESENDDVEENDDDKENDEKKEEAACNDDVDSSWWDNDEDEALDCLPGAERSYEELRNALLDLLTDEAPESRLAVSVLKLCAADGYVSLCSVSKNLNITREKADLICFQLYLANFIKKDLAIEDRYVLAVQESLFYVCCNEVKERKRALSCLAYLLQNIGKQRQKQEQQERALQHKYENDFCFREVVHAKLKALICTNQKMTRVKAIMKAEGCLHVACELGNDEQADVYRGVLYMLNGMSDYRFGRLRTQLLSGE